MFNYLGTIKSEKTDKLAVDRSTIVYNVLIPTIDSINTMEAYVVTQPGIFIRYEINDQVLIGELDTTGQFLILGLIQKANNYGKVSNINIDSIDSIGNMNNIDNLYNLYNPIK